MDGHTSKPISRFSLVAGETLFRCGDQVEFAYVIESGRIETFEGQSDGREKRRSSFGPGTILGLAPANGDQVHQITARAVKTTVLAMIDGALLDAP